MKRFTVLVIAIGFLAAGCAGKPPEEIPYVPPTGPSITEKITPEIPPSEKEMLTVDVFFADQRRDPEGLHCSLVFPTPRQIPKTKAVAKAAITELLKGPTPEESRLGFFTGINSGVRLNFVSITDGSARADFDETLEFQVGGSCRVALIYSQIANTLRQFSSVREVVISINGRTEDILQP